MVVFQRSLHGVLGKQKVTDYKGTISRFLHTYHAIGSRMSLKIRFLQSQVGFFPENLGAVSDGHGES